MLSVFPNLFAYGLFVPLVFRIFIGLYLLRKSVFYLRGQGNADHKSALPGIVCIILGLAILAGFLTQITALVIALIVLVKMARMKRAGAGNAMALDFYRLLFLTALSLVFLGPGIWSIDLPL